VCVCVYVSDGGQKADLAEPAADEVDASDDTALRQLLKVRSPLRELTVSGAYSGEVLTEVLIARRVLSLSLELPPRTAPQPCLPACRRTVC
jgi:hypothetical protein